MRNKNKSTIISASKFSTLSVRENRSCFYCKKVDHIIVHCRKRAAVERRGATSEQKENKNDLNSKIKSSSFFATGLAANTDFLDTDSWILDFRTSHHMTTNKTPDSAARLDCC